MCCYICCFCCFNSCSSPCVEVTSLIFNSISVIMSAIVLFLVNWEYASNLGLVCYIISLVLFVIAEIFLILIIIWRKNGTIKSGNKPKAKGFACSGIVFSIITLLCAVIAEIAIPIAQEDVEYPCKYYHYNDYDDYDDYRGGYGYYRFLEEYDCEKMGSNYRTHKLKYSEIMAPYLCSSFLETCSFLLLMLWISENRRVARGVDGPLTSNNYGTSMGYSRGVVYGAQYPPYGGEQIYAQQVIIQPAYGQNVYGQGYPQVYPPGAVAYQQQVGSSQQQIYAQQAISQSNQQNQRVANSRDQFYQGNQNMNFSEKYH